MLAQGRLLLRRPAYANVLIATLRNLRNRFAHPDMHTIMPPGLCHFTLWILAAEIINHFGQHPEGHPS